MLSPRLNQSKEASSHQALGSSITKFVKRLSPWLRAMLSVYIMLIAVAIVGAGFSWLCGGKEGASQLFAFANNSFSGLIVGVLCTALVQSSSTVTSIIVGLVAGGLPVSMAIPMVMGANIGTTVTNTIVSLSQSSQGDQFERSFSTATVHDFFNVLAVLIFFPLELSFGLLNQLSLFITNMLHGVSLVQLSGTWNNPCEGLLSAPVSILQHYLHLLLPRHGSMLMIAFGIVLIFLSISLLGRILKELLTGSARNILQSSIGKGPWYGVASGTAITMLVQSSSTTTSLAVPLAGSGALSTRELYPFTVGANIGTCITALLASMSVSGQMAFYALQIAVVHLCFNILSTIVIFGIPALRDVPPRLAEGLARNTAKHRVYALAYLLITFFIVPSSLLGMSTYWYPIQQNTILKITKQP